MKHPPPAKQSPITRPLAQTKPGLPDQTEGDAHKPAPGVPVPPVEAPPPIRPPRPTNPPPTAAPTESAPAIGVGS